MVCKQALGQKIKLLRKEQKISQEKFSEMIDISARHLINIEMGYVYPSIEMLQKISSMFSISVKSFFDDEEFDKYYDKSEEIKSRLHKQIDNISGRNLRLLAVIADNLK